MRDVYGQEGPSMWISILIASVAVPIIICVLLFSARMAPASSEPPHGGM
jgi:hypothetical protein